MGRKKYPYDWFRKRLGFLTENDVFKKVNDLGYAPVLTSRPGAWTILKEMLLAYYAPSYLTILRKQSWIKRLVFLDLFSGSGIIGIEGLKRNYLGSPLVITKCIGDKYFDEYHFIESEKAKIDQLEKVFNVVGKPVGTEFHQGDCNKIIPNILRKLSDFGTHSLVFIDPFSMEIDFDTIRLLGQIGCDLIVNVATEEILRPIKQWRANPSWNEPTLDRFFGSSEWKQKLANVEKDEDIYNYYADLITNQAYKKKPIGTKIQKTINGHHYFILFTSTGGKWEEPRFFRILKTFNEKINNLSGDEVFTLIQHYIEGSGKSVMDYFE
ncbi:hypothetical protein Thermo_01660 [Thermoplasmatales archaeon]|nr:hypothetical protein Thermo_01660 [Thermoplasmatales archaeon]